MIHPLSNAVTLAILVLLLDGAAFLLGGYWPRIRDALRGKGGHV
jgi:hypothetical protein